MNPSLSIIFFKKIISLVTITVFLISNNASSQDHATFDAYLLTAPTGHNCKGVVRMKFTTCDCLDNFSGFNVTINDGLLGNFGYCPNVPPGSGTSDISLASGEYDIVATLSQTSSCSNPGEVFTFHVSIPNPECKPPILQIDGIQASTGYNCNDGKFTVHVYPTEDCSAEAGRVRVYDASGVQVSGFDGLWFEGDPWGRTLSLKAGSYTVKGWTNSPDCTDTVITNITIPGPVTCQPPSLSINMVQPVAGPHCTDGKITVHVYPNGSCGADAGRLRLFDASGAQVGSFDGAWYYGDPWGWSFANLKPGTYTIKGWTNVPGCYDTAYGTAEITEPPCTATLSEVSRIDNAAGIFCPDTKKIELRFTSNACFNSWYLEEGKSQLFGEVGSWSAAKDQNIIASLPALKNTSDKYQFTAHLDDMTCVAVYKPSGFKTKGCDATITSALIHAESAPGAGDAEYGFTINASACTDLYGDPWFVQLRDKNTGQSYFTISDSRNLSITGLTEGTYKVSFADNAGICKYPNAGTVRVPSVPSLGVQTEIVKDNKSNSFEALLVPNPAKQVTTLSLIGYTNPVTIILRDMSGKLLWKKDHIREKSISIPLDYIATGVYIISVNDGNQIKTLKLVKSN